MIAINLIPARHPASRLTTHPRRFEILVVDDDPVVRTLLEHLLQQSGCFNVWLAVDGNDALRLYREIHHAVDLVLLDVRMPGLDGPQSLAALRQLNPNVAACFLTGHSGDYTPDDLAALGALRVFHKPFRTDELVADLVALAQWGSRNHFPETPAVLAAALK